jgi:hypothetical protein
MLLLVPMVVAGTVATTEPAPRRSSPSIPTAAYLLLEAPDRRVRAPEPKVRALLATGLSSSPTFASLLTAISETDVIVYIETMMTLPKDTMGRLSMVPLQHGQRYLRIQIRNDLPPRDAIALIAHEMQHALEVATAREVRSDRDMINLYERIGHSSGGEHAYDTDAAQETGRRVRRELAS